ncbi:MAG: hypothetical protein DCC43_10240 [Candidatus Brocadia sp.]|nr:Coenzyme A biosynthesis bifunctional protein CoaBC [Candidatus Brocadia fulgida]MCC6325547.1 hypothetical protein [Candidatus Brocadia sp.]MCE7912393.1 hypothetical protein [Candidatus Brocadia sp. AMX3]MDG5995504.1 hypothetical protein [Candidatus Brocadia sp.]RIJ97544.1 MAG: hypothetical protein DCC43_10240 [Candidatus Brocadia sp.]
MGSLEGLRVLITAGPSRGYIDAVRYVSNTSTGQLGAAIANELLRCGAFVTFVYGTGSAIPDIALSDNVCTGRLTLIEIETVHDLLTVLHEKLRDKPCDAIVHAMAVLDYTPETSRSDKIRSDADKMVVTFVKTPKVIKFIRKLWPHAFLIGFKLEVGLSQEALVERAYTSLQENGADLVVANNQDEVARDKHQAYLVNAQKQIVSYCKTKQDIAKALVTAISNYL